MIKQFNNKRRSSKTSRQHAKKEIIKAVNLRIQHLYEDIEELREYEREYFEDMYYFDLDWYDEDY